MNFQLEITLIINNIDLTTFSDPNSSIGGFDKWFHCFRKSAVFCELTEFSIVLLVTNFVIFLETIRWDFLNLNTQLWDALNIGFKFPISSCKAHLYKSISWIANPDLIAAVNLLYVNLEIIFLYDFHLNVIVFPIVLIDVQMKLF